MLGIRVTEKILLENLDVDPSPERQGYKDVTWVFVKCHLRLGNYLAGLTLAFYTVCPCRSGHSLFHWGNFLRVGNSSWTMETLPAESCCLLGDASLSKLPFAVRASYGQQEITSRVIQTHRDPDTCTCHVEKPQRLLFSEAVVCFRTCTDLPPSLHAII